MNKENMSVIGHTFNFENCVIPMRHIVAVRNRGEDVEILITGGHTLVAPLDNWEGISKGFTAYCVAEAK